MKVKRKEFLEKIATMLDEIGGTITPEVREEWTKKALERTTQEIKRREEYLVENQEKLDRFNVIIESLELHDDLSTDDMELLHARCDLESLEYFAMRKSQQAGSSRAMPHPAELRRGRRSLEELKELVELTPEDEEVIDLPTKYVEGMMETLRYRTGYWLASDYRAGE